MKTDKLLYRIFLTRPSLISEILPGIPPDCEFDYSAPVLKEKEIQLGGVLTPVPKDIRLPLDKMRTDKLFYRIFLNRPSLISEILPGIPADCEFDYSAPVVKEKEIRLDGLLTPVPDDINLPLVFLEAQMDKDTGFFGRYFAGIFNYLQQYEIARPWQGLLILRSRGLELGPEVPYQMLLSDTVKRFYLEDLLLVKNPSPNLALLKLVVSPKKEVYKIVGSILEGAETAEELEKYLDVVEAILVNKFPKLSIEEVRKMLNLREADVTQTRFYQEVLEIGRLEGVEEGRLDGRREGRREGRIEGLQLGKQEGRLEGRKEGRLEGEANLIVRQLSRRFGSLSAEILEGVRSLSIPELESLGETLLDFQTIADLEAWLREHRPQD